MSSRSLRSDYLHSIEHYELTVNDFKSFILYGIIVGVFITIIFLTYLFILDVKDGKYNGYFRSCLKRYKTDTLLPINNISLKKAKESPFIGPYKTTLTPILPNLDDSITTFRRAPFKKEISLYEPETRITITVENTLRH
jgi:hypothetical protein